MTVKEFYAYFNQKIPQSLSCDWDNDGLMCCPDEDRPVRRVLIALDITEAVAKTAVSEKFDVILSHHPLIFHPLRALDPSDPVAKKVLFLVRSGVAAMSFHTRLDAVDGGVNDALAAKLCLRNVMPFGSDGEAMGRIGKVPSPMSLDEFAVAVCKATGAPAVQVADGGRTVSCVALLGGSGSDEVLAAKRTGADTYLTGELKHNLLTDAPELGINLIAAGHFYTEDPVCNRLREMTLAADPSIEVKTANSNAVRTVIAP